MAYGYRDVTIILRHPNFKKSQSTNAFHNVRKKVFKPMFVLESTKKTQNQIMKFDASGKVHFVLVTSLFLT